MFKKIMAIDDYVSVLIHFTDYVKDSSHYPALQEGLQEVSLPGEPPQYAAFGISTIATTRLPHSFIGLLQGHTLIRRVYDGPVPARDYDKINSRLHPKLQEWHVQFMEAERRVRG